MKYLFALEVRTVGTGIYEDLSGIRVTVVTGNDHRDQSGSTSEEGIVMIPEQQLPVRQLMARRVR